MRKLTVPDDLHIDIFGQHDENLRAIEKDLGVRVSARGSEVMLQGDGDRVALAASLIATDKPISELLGWGLTRPKTIAEGFPTCNSALRKAARHVCPFLNRCRC